MITSSEQFFLILAFVVPGFVLHGVMNVFVRQSTFSAELSLLRFMTYSAINYAVASPIVFFLISDEPSSRTSIWVPVGWLFVLLICPTLLGVAWTLQQKWAWIRKGFQKIGLSPIHHVPTAWEWAFGHRVTTPHWVIVTLNDGSEVAGYFGGASMASSEPEERDIYIEEVFAIPKEGSWTCRQGSKGILISKDRISHVEFIAKEEGSKNE